MAFNILVGIETSALAGHGRFRCMGGIHIGSMKKEEVVS